MCYAYNIIKWCICNLGGIYMKSLAHNVNLQTQQARVLKERADIVHPFMLAQTPYDNEIKDEMLRKIHQFNLGVAKRYTSSVTMDDASINWTASSTFDRDDLESLYQPVQTSTLDDATVKLGQEIMDVRSKYAKEKLKIAHKRINAMKVDQVLDIGRDLVL